jgi:hypothetical protein
MPRKNAGTSTRVQNVNACKAELDKLLEFDSIPTPSSRLFLWDVLKSIPQGTRCVRAQQQQVLFRDTQKMCFICEQPTEINDASFHSIPLAPFNLVVFCKACAPGETRLPQDHIEAVGSV